MVEAVRIRVYDEKRGKEGGDEPIADGMAKFLVNDVDEICLEIDDCSVMINSQDLLKALGTVRISY